MRLYEIRDSYLEFLELVANGEIPEEAIEGTKEFLEVDLTDKVDNIASYIKNLTAEAFAIREEEKALAERRQVKEAKIDRLKEYLSSNLQALGKDLVETPRNRVSFRKSVSLAYEPEALDKLGDEWFAVKKEVRKKDLTDAIKAGQTFEGIYLQEKRNLQLK